MASGSFSGPFWYFTPLQIATTVVAGMNAGASWLQSPLTWPMLQEVDVPPHYTGRQTENLLHGSEHLFPPFNAVSTLGNLIQTGVYYYNRDNVEAAAKLPFTAVGFGFAVATTVYTLTIMAPYNEKLKQASKKMNAALASGGEKSDQYQQAEKDFREAQAVWKFRNHGRGLIMMGLTIANALALIA